MKRAFSQDVKSVPDLTADQSAAEGSSKQSIPEANRRVRTSAAMTIGLAISVGASGLLLPQEGGNAMATEPGTTDSLVPKATDALAENIGSVSSPENVEPARKTAVLASTPRPEQTLQAGETLDREADISREDVVAVASVSTTWKSDFQAQSAVEVGWQPRQNSAFASVKLEDLTAKETGSQEAIADKRLESGVAQQPQLIKRNFPLWQKGLPITWEPKDSSNTGVFVPVAALQESQNDLRIHQSRDFSQLLLPSQAPTVVALNPRVNVTRVAPRSVSQAREELGRLSEVVSGSSRAVSSTAVTMLPLALEKSSQISQTQEQPRALFAVPPISSKNLEQQEASVAVFSKWETSKLRNDTQALTNLSETLKTQLPVQVTDSGSQQKGSTVVDSPTTQMDSLKAEIEGLQQKYRTQVVQQPNYTQQTVANGMMPLNIASSWNLQTTKFPSHDEHRVSPGETLDAIARRYGVSRTALVEANQLSNPHLIKVDQILKIPQTDSGSATYPTGTQIGDRWTNASNSPSIELSLPQQQKAPVTLGGSHRPLATRSVSGSLATNLPLPSPSNQKLYNDRLSAAPSMPPIERELEQTSTAGDRHVQRLLDEVNQLRQEIQTQKNGARRTLQSVPVQKDNPLPSTEQFPESQDSRSRPSRSSIENPQQIAAASPGPEIYYNEIPDNFNRTVSPELPPLAPPDTYLPEGVPAFGYIWPAAGTLTSQYGWRWGRMHKGIDVAGPIGTPIVAAQEGIVTFAGWNSGGYGNLVDIKHSDGSLTRYAHNHRILVRKGQQVNQGQQIAEMGSTGYSTGPHLHFEIHPKGQGAVNPIAFLPKPR